MGVLKQLIGKVDPAATAERVRRAINLIATVLDSLFRRGQLAITNAGKDYSLRATPGWFDVRDFGAKVDGVVLSDAHAITSGSKTLVVTGGTFTRFDRGKRIWVDGAGAGGAQLDTLIASYTSATTVELAVAASTTVSVSAGRDRRVCWGTNDTVAVQAAIDAAGAAGGGTVYFPRGVCVVVAPVSPDWGPALGMGPAHNRVTWRGEGAGVSELYEPQARFGDHNNKQSDVPADGDGNPILRVFSTDIVTQQTLSDIAFYDLTFRNNSQEYNDWWSGVGVFYFSDAGDSVPNITIYGLRIENCRFDSKNRVHVSLGKPCRDVFITNNEFRGLGEEHVYLAGDCQRVNIDGNKFRASYYDLSAQTFTSLTPAIALRGSHNVTITGNYLEGFSFTGVHARGDIAPGRYNFNLTVTGNVFENFLSGANPVNLSSARGATVTGNVFRNNPSASIVVLFYSQDVTISGNEILGPGIGVEIAPVAAVRPARVKVIANAFNECVECISSDDVDDCLTIIGNTMTRAAADGSIGLHLYGSGTAYRIADNDISPNYINSINTQIPYFHDRRGSSTRFVYTDSTYEVYADPFLSTRRLVARADGTRKCLSVEPQADATKGLFVEAWDGGHTADLLRVNGGVWSAVVAGNGQFAHGNAGIAPDAFHVIQQNAAVIFGAGSWSGATLPVPGVVFDNSEPGGWDCGVAWRQATSTGVLKPAWALNAIGVGSWTNGTVSTQVSDFQVIGRNASGVLVERFRFLAGGGVKVNGAYTLPAADGTANSVVATDGAGNWSYYDAYTSLVPKPLWQPFAPGSFTLATGRYAIVVDHLTLNSTETATLQGGSILRML